MRIIHFDFAPMEMPSGFLLASSEVQERGPSVYHMDLWTLRPHWRYMPGSLVYCDCFRLGVPVLRCVINPTVSSYASKDLIRSVTTVYLPVSKMASSEELFYELERWHEGH